MPGETNYTQGYSKATVATHATRTVDSDAAFVLPFLQPTDKVLDVGCGPGTITVGFAAHVPQGSVTGLDISPDVLEQARSLTNLPSNVSFIQGDLLKGLGMEDDQYDVVFNSQLFPHLNSKDMRLTALREMRRVLKPGGILGSRDAAELHFYPRKHGLDHLWAENMAKALGALLPGGDMPGLFGEIGFDGAKVKIGAGTTVYSGTESRTWFVDACLGRLQDGEPFRESWRRVGISDDEVDECKKALGKWAQDEDAWYVALHAEVLGWK